jgi:hypothetical protein
MLVWQRVSAQQVRNVHCLVQYVLTIPAKCRVPLVPSAFIFLPWRKDLPLNKLQPLRQREILHLLVTCAIQLTAVRVEWWW